MDNSLIFLDIDGVLNSHDWWSRQPDEPTGVSAIESSAIDPLACQRLQRICDAFGAVIVLTSTWRLILTYDQIHDIVAQKGLTAPIIGRTPDLRSCGLVTEEPWSRFGRGLEVQWWLQHYLPTDEAVCAARFVCIDDDADYGDLLGKLVQTSITKGLTDLEGDYIAKHLREPLMESSAAGGKGRVFFKYDTKSLIPHWGQQTGPFGPPRL